MLVNSYKLLFIHQSNWLIFLNYCRILHPNRLKMRTMKRAF